MTLPTETDDFHEVGLGRRGTLATVFLMFPGGPARVTPRLKVALVGAGSMGLSHARVLAASPHTDLSVVIDPHEGAARLLG